MGWMDRAKKSIEKIYQTVNNKCRNIKWYRDEIEKVYDRMEHVEKPDDRCPKCDLGHILDNGGC